MHTDSHGLREEGINVSPLAKELWVGDGVRGEKETDLERKNDNNLGQEKEIQPREWKLCPDLRGLHF